MSDWFSLPYSPDLKVDRLAGIFNKYTNSYKFLWFKAILNILKSSENIIKIDEILFEILKEAYYPLYIFNLSFGSADGIRKIFDLYPVLKKKEFLFNPKRKDEILELIHRGAADDLKRYVPTRLLVPFVEDHLKGCKDQAKDKRILYLLESTAVFSEEKTLYRFREESIEIHLDWKKYLEKNTSIIQGWYYYHWILFLQSRNPNVPAIPAKIMEHQTRNSLRLQRDFWMAAARLTPLVCIYSGKPIRDDEFHLDHFIPWSFVGHDQLWNLVPVDKIINSTKNDRIPHRRFLEKMAERHHRALEETRRSMDSNTWNKTVESYQADLHIDLTGDIVLEQVQSAYQTIVQSLLNLAVNSGFSGNWEP